MSNHTLRDVNVNGVVLVEFQTGGWWIVCDQTRRIVRAMPQPQSVHDVADYCSREEWWIVKINWVQARA